MPVHARWGHQLGNTVDHLQRREGDLIGLCTPLVVGAEGLAVLLGAALDPLTASLAQQPTRKRWTRAGAQQTLQASAVLRSNAHAGVYRETAVLVKKYLFILKS
jgi:hypothetical protein